MERGKGRGDDVIIISQNIFLKKKIVSPAGRKKSPCLEKGLRK